MLTTSSNQVLNFKSNNFPLKNFKNKNGQYLIWLLYDALTCSYIMHLPVVSGPTLGETRSHCLCPYRGEGVGGILFKKKRINKNKNKKIKVETEKNGA